MTAEGGSAGQGVVFRMNIDGSGFTILHSFVPSTGDGWDPLGSLTLVGSTLYGMTHFGGGGAGTIFEINTDGTNYNRLHTFTGQFGGDGANPVGNDLLAVGSQLFGMTTGGGTDALGVLFGINTDGTDYSVLHSFVGGGQRWLRPDERLNPRGLRPIGHDGSGRRQQRRRCVQLPDCRAGAVDPAPDGGSGKLLPLRPWSPVGLETR